MKSALRWLISCCLIAAAFAQTPPPQTQTPPPTQDPRGIGLKPDPNKPDPNKSGPRTTEKPELILQTGHAEKIDAIAFTPDGRYLASGSSDRTIKLWDAVAARELRTLGGNAGGVRALAFSPDGLTLASAGNDGRIRLWDAASGQITAVLAGHPQPVNALAFSPDGHTLASGGSDFAVKLWDVAARRETAELTGELKGHAGWVLALAFSPDGRTLASGSADKTVKLWDVAAGRAIASLNQFADRVRSVAFSPNGQLLAAGGNDGVARVWRLAANQAAPAFAANIGKVVTLAFTPDGAQLLVAAEDRAIKRFAATTGAEQAPSTERDKLERYESAAFSPDGTWLAACSGRRVLELRPTVGSDESRVLESIANEVKAVAFSPDGRWFASGNQDTSVTLWDVLAGRVVANLAGNGGSVNAVAFNPDSLLLASGGLGGAIKLWDVVAAREVRSWAAHGDGVNALLYTNDGRLISAGGDATIKVWDAATGGELFKLPGHTGEITSLGLSPDGRRLASGSADKTVRLWDLTNRSAVRTLAHADTVFAVGFSPDGRWLAAGGADQTVKLWDAAQGSPVRAFADFTGRVYSLAFSGDASRLVAGISTGEIKVWETATGQLQTTLAGHTGDVNTVVFGLQGKWLASGSQDGSVRVWAGATLALAATLVSLRAGDDWLVVAPDGLFDGSPASWGRIMWRFARNTFNAAPVESYFNEFYYPELLGDVLAQKQPRAGKDISLRDRRLPVLRLDAATTSHAAVNSRNVAVKLTVTDAPADKTHTQGGGAQDVRLFRNGALVKVWRGDALRGRGSVTLEHTVQLTAGENLLTAYAFNRDNVKSVDAKLTLTGAEALRQRGTVYILAVGVNEYANPGYNLRFARNDAVSFGAELVLRQRQQGRFGDVALVNLFDAQATKANLVAALKRFSGDASPTPGASSSLLKEFEQLQRAQPEDVVIVYFAGHGVADGDRFYLIPHDLGYAGNRDQIDEAAIRRVLARSLSDIELERLVENIDAGQMLFVLDACNSGQALEAAEKRRGPMNSKGLAQLAYEKGMNILTAAQSYQVAIETAELQHGYLTYALIEDGVKRLSADRAPRDGQILLREWLNYALEKVPQMQEAKHKSERVLLRRRLTTKEIQRPRVFFRRELERRPLVIVTTK